MSFHREGVVKCTRKQRHCDWCGQAIPVGSRAVSFVGYFEDFYRGHLHLECGAARNKADIDWDEGYMPYTQARGRRDDERSQPPEFTEEDYLRNEPQINPSLPSKAGSSF